MSQMMMPWANYVAANPTTKPRDVQIVQQAIKQMPEGRSKYPVRMSDMKGVEGHVDSHMGVLQGAPEVWLSRGGANYKSQNPTRVAGTLVHEGAHLEGASELDARRTQLQFLQEAIAGGAQGLGGYLKQFEDALRMKERHAERPGMGHLARPMIRK